MMTKDTQNATRRPAISLITVVLASLLLPISLTGSSVAMPGVANSFHNTLASGQWIVNGYDLTFASFMLACGAFADRFGRRKVFAIGTAVFALCTLVSAVSNGIVLLDAARAVAGIGAGAMLTAGSATLAQVFDGPARAKAFGVFGTAVGVGMAFGPFIAGSLSTSFGWRSIFYVPAIAGAVVLLLVPFLPETRDPDAKKVDWAGTISFSGALAALIAALIEGSQLGWASGFDIAMYAVFAVLITVFVRVELAQERPMFDLSLFKQPQFLSLCVAVVALVVAFTPLLVYLPSYLSSVNGATLRHAGVDMLMLTVPTIFFPLIAGYVMRWIPIRHLVTASVGFTAIGTGWLTVLHPGVGNWEALGPYAIIGIGIGVSFGVMDGAAVSSVDPARAGMAAGMFNTMRLTGEAIGIAVVGALMVSFTRSRLGSQLNTFTGAYGHQPGRLANTLNQGRLADAQATVPQSARSAFHSVATHAYTGGLHTSMWVMAIFCAAATVLVAVVGARSAHPAPQSAGDAAPATEPARV
ncbi:MFS transporter [Streptomyces sp. SL13]|uniref:MFS transporter n=1 Tax=Streptantibioticus silvisoli TaxID=2705255 RepID=A0AA90H0X8_9ACTN|nr:MFS transporter [Streptantibioticus silvisoli]MDI5963304.1 MFS transporter [Streptantibioticus silvisoli]MDI5968515.1 MFS transporter [Streptantibioticus silvisoli]